MLFRLWLRQDLLVVSRSDVFCKAFLFVDSKGSEVEVHTEASGKQLLRLQNPLTTYARSMLCSTLLTPSPNPPRPPYQQSPNYPQQHPSCPSQPSPLSVRARH